MGQKLCRLVYDVFIHFERCLTLMGTAKEQGWEVMGLIVCWNRTRDHNIQKHVTRSYSSQCPYNCSFQMKYSVNISPPMVVVNTNYVSVQETESLSVVQLIYTLRNVIFFQTIKAWHGKCSTEISLAPFPSNQAFRLWLLSQFRLMIDNLKACESLQNLDMLK